MKLLNWECAVAEPRSFFGIAAHLNDQFPFCFTEKVSPATVIAPLRPDPVGLAATEKPTTPVPMPTPFEVIVIQPALLAACHAHWVPVDGTVCLKHS